MKRYSLIIPVLNEADEINALISHLKSLGKRDGEIILVDGSPEGDTLRAVKDQDVCCLTSPAGRAKQMNAGAARAAGGILVFLHADTRLPAEALALIDGAMKGETCVGGAFDLQIGSTRFIYKGIALAASLRSRLTRVPYGDQAIFIRRDFFDRLGGYPDIPLMEDVALMRRIKRAGGRICFISAPVVTSPRRWEKEGILYTTLRNWMLMTLYSIGVSPETLSKYYKSGKAAYGA